MNSMGLDFLGKYREAGAILIFLTLAIYVVILFVFYYARSKYTGGIIEKTINLVIATIGLFLVADAALFLVPSYGFLTGYTVHVVFKIFAMVCLAIGGLKFLEK